MGMCVMLCRKGTVCAWKRGETITSYSYPSGHKYKALFFFFFAQFCHIIVVTSRPNACTFFSSTHTYIHSSRRCVQASSLSRTKIFLFFSFTHIHTDDGEKIAAGRKRRTRLSILRNDDVWARVYTQASVLFLLLT